MELVNNTPLPAALVPNAETDRVVTLLIVAATFHVGSAATGGGLVVDEEQLPLALVCEPPEMGDGYITKAGTSVCVTGHVHAQAEGARRSLARLRVGDIEKTVAAFGPRVWREGLAGELAATAPLPFERVAMTWKNAFGGSVWRPTTVHKRRGEEVIVPEHDEAFGLNFDGTGFYPDRSFAVDQPLPQLEDPEHLIERWSDRPEPVCFAPYPMHGGMRALAAVKDGALDYARHGHVLSRAAPRTTFVDVPPGTRIEVEGMRPGGEVLAFEVPPPPVAATARAGERGRQLALYVDAVDLDADAARVRIAYRAVFAYELLQFEVRLATLETTGPFDAMIAAAGRPRGGARRRPEVNDGQ